MGRDLGLGGIEGSGRDEGKGANAEGAERGEERGVALPQPN